MAHPRSRAPSAGDLFDLALTSAATGLHAAAIEALRDCTERAPNHAAACFAMFKQTLPNEATFSCDLEELGQYYNTYVGLMDHRRSVLPGAVHFMRYEDLVEDSESEIRRLLQYCGVPFEERCLRHWESERAVSTPSAEQVRRPIFRDALEHGRHYETWLGPLRQALDRPTQA